MYSMEIKDKNCNILGIFHFLDLVKAYDFVRNFDCLHWAWDAKWQYIYVYRIANECDAEYIATEFLQFSITREAYEELKR